MKIALVVLGLLIAHPVMGTASEQQCNTAGNKAVQAKRLIDRGESPQVVSDLIPASKVEEEAVYLAINNRGLNQEDLRFLAVTRCKIMLMERQQMLQERQRRP